MLVNNYRGNQVFSQHNKMEQYIAFWEQKCLKTYVLLTPNGNATWVGARNRFCAFRFLVVSPLWEAYGFVYFSLL